MNELDAKGAVWDFATGRPGWKAVPIVHTVYAERVMVPAGSHYFRLRIWPEVNGRDLEGKCFNSYDRVVACIHDGPETVFTWVRRFEKAIALIERLWQCAKVGDVRHLASELSGTEVWTLAFVLGVKSCDEPGTTLAQCVREVTGRNFCAPNGRLAHV